MTTSLPLQDLGQPESLAIKLHVRREFAPPREILGVRLAPIGERAIVFALVVCEGRVDLSELSPSQLNALQDGARPPLAVLDDPALADNDAFVAF
jgi:hypothetical protein